MTKRRSGKKSAVAGGGGSGQVRIIGGRWRGTKLPVPDLPGLRPTGDRARETLFNWLMPTLPGAACLDLFAGTGALGLEALSRGAATCTLVERDRAAATALASSIAKLAAAPGASLIVADAESWLGGCRQTFDVVFVDPPYSLNIWTAIAGKLTQVLNPRALIYLETPLDLPLTLPAEFEHYRQKSTPMTQLRLFRWAGKL